MRIALIADTHGHIDPRIADAVRGADVLVHAGDVGDGIEAAITPLAKRIVIVQGNNDPGDSGWPESEVLDLPGGKLAVIHGDQWPAKTRHRKMRERYSDILDEAMFEPHPGTHITEEAFNILKLIKNGFALGLKRPLCQNNIVFIVR